LTGSRPFHVVALGASNTAGFGVGQHQAYPAALEKLLLARGITVRVHNAGVSGQPTGQMLARLDDAAPAGTHLVTFQPGSNDARLGLLASERERNIATITERLTARGIPVVRVAAAFAAARSGNLQADGIHFTAAGHAIVAQLIVDEVATLLIR
jgi:acyl-CoA thioesterase I